MKGQQNSILLWHLWKMALPSNMLASLEERLNIFKISVFKVSQCCCSWLVTTATVSNLSLSSLYGTTNCKSGYFLKFDPFEHHQILFLWWFPALGAGRCVFEPGSACHVLLELWNKRAVTVNVAGILLYLTRCFLSDEKSWTHLALESQEVQGEKTLEGLQTC